MWAHQAPGGGHWSCVVQLRDAVRPPYRSWSRRLCKVDEKRTKRPLYLGATLVTAARRSTVLTD